MSNEDMEYITIGRFYLEPMLPGKIWIEEKDGGEGGEFSIAKLEKVIADFYKEHF